MPVTAQRYEANADLAALTEHPRNPRRGDDAVVSQSVSHNGFYGVIIVHAQTGHVLAGHTRRRVLLDQGTTTAPAVFVDCDEDTATRILLADNQTAALASWDDRALLGLLEDLSIAGPDALLGTGFDPGYLDALMADLRLDEVDVSPIDPMAEQDDRQQRYDTTEVRQIMLVMQRADYDKLIAALDQLRSQLDLPSYAAVVQRLVYDKLGVDAAA